MQTIKIGLSEWQKKVLAALRKHRFVVVSAGRQCGKTHLCAIIITLKALENQGTVSWWVAPVYQQARVGMRRVRQFLRANLIPHKVNLSELRISLGDSVIDFRSAEREDTLRGETVNFMVVDETGLIKRDAWEYSMRGTISATQAQVLFIGTPKGKNLFYELYCKGQDPLETEYASFQIESKESPYFDPKEWASVKRLPQRIFEQEYKAHFIEDGGEVFRNVRDCVRGRFEEPIAGKAYFAGVDLAKSVDYTVICILDETGHVVAYDRFNELSWSIQKDRIKRLCGRYGAVAHIDSTGVGDPIVEELSLEGVQVVGLKFTNITKRQIIEGLAMGVERAEVSFPEIPELINELNIFTFEQLPSGMLRYGAPEGLHDDCVISLALAWWLYAGGQGMEHAFSDETGRIFDGT